MTTKLGPTNSSPDIYGIAEMVATAPTRGVTARAVELAFEELIACQHDLYEATEAHTTTVDALRLAEVRETLAGLQGSNKETRDADLAKKTFKQHSEVFDSESILRRVKNNFECARLKVESLKWIIRATAQAVEL